MGLPPPSSFQYPLHLRLATGFESDDFFTSHCNEEATLWLRNWPQWSHYGLCLVGPQGSGKTHLARIWQGWVGATLFNFAELDEKNLFQKISDTRGMIFDGLTPFSSPQEERLFLHVFNVCQEVKRPFLVTATSSPSTWDLGLSDLTSRLKILTTARLHAPDDMLIRMMLIKQLKDQHLDIPEDVIAFLLPRIERSYPAVKKLAEDLHLLSLSAKRLITIPLARQALGWADEMSSLS